MPDSDADGALSPGHECAGERLRGRLQVELPAAVGVPVGPDGGGLVGVGFVLGPVDEEDAGVLLVLVGDDGVVEGADVAACDVCVVDGGVEVAGGICDVDDEPEAFGCGGLGVCWCDGGC